MAGRHDSRAAAFFGMELAVLRELAGLTESELAQKVGCHYNTIRNLEKGRTAPAWDLALALAAALGVGVEAFAVPATERRTH